MLKKLAALATLLGILAGTALIALLIRNASDWAEVDFIFKRAWMPLAISAGVFLFTAMIAAMTVLFAKAPVPPGPDPEMVAALKLAQGKLIDLQAEVDEGEKRQVAFQGEAARAQAEVISLNGKLSHLESEMGSLDNRQIQTLTGQISQITAEYEAFKERVSAAGDVELAKLQIRDLNEQVKELTRDLNKYKDRDAALTENEQAQANARELAKTVPGLTSELVSLRERQVELVNDLDRFKERMAELNSELIQVADRKRALNAERDELKRQIDEMKQEHAAPAGPSNKIAPDAAFQILFLLQKEGRLLDFLNEDLSGVGDQDLGGAIRPIHESLKKILQDRLVVEPVLPDSEGDEVSLGNSVDPDRIKLTGNVSPNGPFKGVLVHRGWKLKSCKLPELVSGWTSDVIVPAEVEIP